jgi:hypothetical protein
VGMNFEPDYRFVCVSVHCFNDPIAARV